MKVNVKTLFFVAQLKTIVYAMMSEYDGGRKMDVEQGKIDILQVLEIVKKPMQKDEYWYLLDKKWFEQFEQFIRDNEPTHNPGPIDNRNLFKSTGNVPELKEKLQEELDYKFIPEEAWQMLVSYFGIQDENYTIKRLVIEQGNYSSFCMVEVYPIELKLRTFGTGPSAMNKQYSRITTLQELEEDMKRMFDIKPTQDTQIYHANVLLLNKHVEKEQNAMGDTATTVKTNDNKTLAEAGLYNGNIITLEIRNEDGTWPSNKTKYNRPATRSSVVDKSHLSGLCGLTNIGNTCFMNSALQCLSNTPPLTEFIVSGKYLEEINEDNVVGMGGEIAKTYGQLIKNMWIGHANYISPTEFKFAVGRFAPQFSGYAQQDSQELMAFLLDGLHEDLNRIKKKPYIEVKTDVDRRPDYVIAQEAWENYKKRNDSIIVDTFHGLLKSTLVCPECKLVSATFDPFCYLSLPLPDKREKQINVIFVPALVQSKQENENNEINKEIKAIALNRVRVPKYGCVSDISRAVAKAVNDENILTYKIDSSNLLVTCVYNHRFHKVFENEEAISMSMDNLIVYEVMSDDKLAIPVYLREVKTDETMELFGRPFLIGVNDADFDTIYQSVTNHLKRFMKFPVSDDSSDEGVAECDNEEGIFSLSLTNSFGTMEIEKLDRSKPIPLNNMSYLAVDLSTKSKAKYYDEFEMEYSHNINLQKTATRTSIPLSECILNFTSTERLGADDLWHCPVCKKHQHATKKFDLWDLPNVLIIHLKRFSYSRFLRDKLDTLVDFPIIGLNMGDFVINNPDKKPMIYDLIAVANHFGGLGGGHYTAHAKNQITQKWYHFNDSTVTVAAEDDVVSNSGYVLYYLKRSEALTEA